MNAKPKDYEVVDKHTGNVIRTNMTLSAACKLVDRKDNEYGAYRYSHRRIAK